MQELRSIYRARIHAWEVWLPSTPHWLLWLRPGLDSGGYSEEMGLWVAGEAKAREGRQDRQLSWYHVDFLKLAVRRGNGKEEPKSQQPDFSIPSVKGTRELPRKTMCQS